MPADDGNAVTSVRDGDPAIRSARGGSPTRTGRPTTWASPAARSRSAGTTSATLRSWPIRSPRARIIRSAPPRVQSIFDEGADHGFLDPRLDQADHRPGDSQRHGQSRRFQRHLPGPVPDRPRRRDLQAAREPGPHHRRHGHHQPGDQRRNLGVITSTSGNIAFYAMGTTFNDTATRAIFDSTTSGTNAIAAPAIGDYRPETRGISASASRWIRSSPVCWRRAMSTAPGSWSPSTPTRPRRPRRRPRITSSTGR